MKGHMKFALNTALFGIVLNLVLPLVFKLVPLKRDNTFIGKFLKMMDHHKDTPVVSSFIVGLVCFVACVLSHEFKLF